MIRKTVVSILLVSTIIFLPYYTGLFFIRIIGNSLIYVPYMDLWVFGFATLSLSLLCIAALIATVNAVCIGVDILKEIKL